MGTTFIDFIKTMADVPSGHEEKFLSLVSEKEIKKGSDFIGAGQFPKSLGFVKEGLFRYYYIDRKGEEFTKGFFPEGTVLSSYSAMIEKRPSYFAIQALEDSKIEVVDYLKVSALLSDHPCWKDFLIAQLQKAFITKETREREFLLLDAEERYFKFKERFPTLENRIRQHIIASYLGIAPESLSRIRRKIYL
ncbi:MAG: Crp/Fnr family transcriptional regulator [Cytophagales bacterium]|nr:Crp/Fnr family transcriptional regulator [Cytophagales bacterium]